LNLLKNPFLAPHERCRVIEINIMVKLLISQVLELLLIIFQIFEVLKA
jgi:hypothetical protein